MNTKPFVSYIRAKPPRFFPPRQPTSNVLPVVAQEDTLNLLLGTSFLLYVHLEMGKRIYISTHQMILIYETVGD
jgi:hypothetical protein